MSGPDPYAGSETTVGTEGGVYFVPGNFRIRVTKVIDKTSWNGVRNFIVSTEIVQVYGLKDPKEALVVGEKPANVIKFDKFPDLAKGNMFDFMRIGLAAKAAFEAGRKLEPTPAGIVLDGATCREITGEDNILVGVELDVYAFRKKPETSNYTTVQWSVPKDALAIGQARLQQQAVG